MTYRKEYPHALSFDIEGTTLHVRSSGKTKCCPDLWGVKKLFDGGLGNLRAKVFVDSSISKTMALRMYFLKYLFPNIEFHDSKDDMFIKDAEEIIENIRTKKYVTYKSKDHPFNDRGTKDKLESKIEKELCDNLGKYILDFTAGVKVKRQFPSNIFDGTINKNSRVTDKLWIDMVSLNAAQELSPIELKVGGNIPLDLFAQGLDYGIYCHLFQQHIKDQWFNVCNGAKKDKVTIYYVGENFHPALIGRGENGIISLINKNNLFNIVFIRLEIDKTAQHIAGSENIFDTRNL